MSKEATGQFNVKIGGKEYWSRLNLNAMFGSLMEDRTDYCAMLQRLGSRASEAIEEIYNDLSELGGTMGECFCCGTRSKEKGVFGSGIAGRQW